MDAILVTIYVTRSTSNVGCYFSDYMSLDQSLMYGCYFSDYVTGSISNVRMLF